MNRRTFLLSALTAALLALPPATHHPHIPDYACHPKEISRHAVNGPCYVFIRGTYDGWPRPGVPVI